MCIYENVTKTIVRIIIKKKYNRFGHVFCMKHIVQSKHVL